jgi:uncharacterized protein YebE (UPF0316 family)
MSEAITPKLYLETTIFNFYYYGKAKKRQQDTLKLFDYIAAGRYLVYTSDYAVKELVKDNKEKFDKMYSLIKKYDIIVLPTSDEIQRLAGRYIAQGIIPKEYPDDARHLATTAVNRLDFCVSCNMGHITKQKAMIGTGFVNMREGYPRIGITTPEEILEYDKPSKD